VEIMFASTMKAVLVAFFALVTSTFQNPSRTARRGSWPSSPTRGSSKECAASSMSSALRQTSVDLAAPILVALALFPSHRSTRNRPPRIHGELLKLGIEVAQLTVAKYLQRSRRPLSQTWRTFLRNHVGQMASIDSFTIPTATFRVLLVFVVLSHERRRVLHFQGDRTPQYSAAASSYSEAFSYSAPRL
jgi:hypothetical protein